MEADIREHLLFKNEIISTELYYNLNEAKYVGIHYSDHCTYIHVIVLKSLY